MNKKRNNELIFIADQALRKCPKSFLKNGVISDSYNGQISALGVAIAMSGLLPALAIFYAEGSDTRAVDRRLILHVVSDMIARDKQAKDDGITGITGADSLLRFAIVNEDNSVLFKTLQKRIVECSVALKQVVRTYNLVKNEKS